MTENVTCCVRIEFPDHLQHQQLVEIGIQQAAHDRVEAPAVVVGTRCDVGDCGHGGKLTVPGKGQPVPERAELACFLMNGGRF